MKSASASFFCSFYPTFNKIQVYARLNIVLPTQQICLWKMRNENKCVTFEFSQRFCTIFKSSGLWRHAGGQIKSPIRRNYDP